MDFISFASWTQLKLLFDNVRPILMEQPDDTYEQILATGQDQLQRKIAQYYWLVIPVHMT